MADDLVMKLGVELDLSNVQSQINASSKNSKIQITADTKQAEQSVKNFRQSISGKTPAKILIDVLKGQSEKNISGFIDGIQTKYQNKPIKLVFDVDTKATEANIKNAMQNMQQQVQKAAQAAGKAAGGGTGAGSGGNAPQVSGYTKYYDELYKAAQKFGDAFEDVNAKISHIRIKDNLDGTQSAVVKFTNALGELTDVAFKLEDGGNWEAIGAGLSKSFKDGSKEIEKTLKYVADMQNRLNSKKASTFDKNATKTLYAEINDLTNKQFAQPVIDQIDLIQGKIDQLHMNATKKDSNGLDIGIAATLQDTIELEKEFSRLNDIINEQKNARWSPTTFADTDVKSFVERYKNMMVELSNALKDDGVYDRFSTKISNMFSSLQGVKNGTVSTGDFINQVRNLKQEISTFESSVKGQGIMEAFDISQDQLARIKEISKVFDSQASTDGIEKKKRQLEELANKYEDVQRIITSKGVSRERLNDQGIITGNLDKELKEIENIASRLGNEQWVSAQQAGIANMKAQFAQYREEISSTIQLTPQLQAQMDALADVMSRDGAIDITNWQTINNQFKELKGNIQPLQDEFKNQQGLENFQLKVEGLQQRLERLREKYEEFLRANPGKGSADVEQRLEHMAQTLENLNPSGLKNATAEMTNLNRAVSNTINPAQSLSQILSQNLGGVGQYLARFTSAFYIINKVVSGIKSMVNSVKEVDSALLELQKVTNLTGSSLDQFTEKAYRVGESLGRTGQDVIQATATFSRAGYDLQEATELAKSALVMTNVGADIQSTEAAASDMISILKAFDKQADESMGVIDKLYNVSNKEPLDFGNLTQMLVTAGGTLAQAGTSLEESMALLTGGFATMRNQNVANGLIMISQRLRGVKEDGEAIEEAGFMPKLKKMFSGVGIDIEDSNGELRSTYDILSDLAGVWDQLSSKQRQYFGEKVAGNRQVKTLNAIMQNWDVVEDTIQKANEANDAAAEGNEKYLDSINGRITQLKSAFQELATTTIDSDFVKGIVSAGTGITKLVTDMGGLVPILTTALGIFVQFKSLKIVNGIKNIQKALETASVTAKAFSFSLSAIGVTITAISAGIAIGKGLVSLLKELNILPKTYMELQEVSEKATLEYKEEKTKLEDLNGELKNTQQLINNLEGKTSLTIIEQDELNRLKETNSELERQIKLQKEKTNIRERKARNAAIDTFEALQNTNKSEVIEIGDETAEAGATLFAINPSKFSEIVNQTNRDLASYRVEGEDYKSAVLNAYNTIGYYKQQYDEAQYYVDKLVDESTDLSKTMETNEYKTAVAVRDLWKENYEDRYQILVDYQDKAEEKLGDYDKIESPKTDRERAFNQIKDEVSAGGLIDELLDMLVGNSVKYITNRVLEKYPEVVKEIEKQANKLGDSFDFSNIYKGLEESGTSAEDTGIYKLVNELSTKLERPVEDVIQIINEIYKQNSIQGFSIGIDDVALFSTTEAYKELTAAMTEQEKAGSISAETWKKLLSTEGLAEIEEHLVLTANGYALNTSAVQDFIAAQEEERKQNAAKGIMERQIAIQKLQEENKKLEDSFADLSDADKKLLDDNDETIKGYEAEIEQLKAVWLEANNATGALNRYREASKSANQDAEHTEGQGIFKSLQESWKSGKIGTDDFQASMDYLLGDGWLEKYEGNLEKAFKEASKIGEKYFGSDDLTNMTNFRKELVNKGFATYDAETGQLTMLTSSLEEVAKAFGMSEDAAESLFGLINSYSYGNQITFDKTIASEEEVNAAIKAAEQLNEEYEKEQKILDNMSPDSEGFEEQTEKVEKLATKAEEAKSAVETLQETVANPNAQPMTYEEAVAELEKLQGLVTWLNTQGITIPAEVRDKTRTLESLVQQYERGSGVFGNSQFTLTADDQATPKVQGVKEEVNGLNDVSGEATLDAKDEASPKIAGAIKGVASFKTVSGKATIDANDQPLKDTIADANDSLSTFDTEAKAKAEIEGDKKDLDKDIAAAHHELYHLTQEYTDTPIPINFLATDNGTIGEIIKAADDAAVDRTIHFDYQNGHYDENGNWIGVAEVNSAPKRENYNPDVYDPYGKDEIEGLKKLISFYKSIGPEAADKLADAEARLAEAEENQAKKIEESYKEEEPHWPMQPWQNGGPPKDITPNDNDYGSNGLDEVIEGGAVQTDVINFDELFPPSESQNVYDNNSNTGDNNVNSWGIEFFTDDSDDFWDNIQKKADQNPIKLTLEDVSDEDITHAIEGANQLIAESSSIDDIDMSQIEAMTKAYNELRTAYLNYTTLKDENNGANVEKYSSALKEAAKNFSSAYKSLSAKVNAVQTVRIDANVQQALKKIDGLSNEEVTVKVNADVQKPGQTFSNSYDKNKQNGVLSAKGTKNARDVLSLVDDGNGPELIEHRKSGTYEIGSGDGPRLVKLDNGDVVHTAEDTKRILSRVGKIGGFFRKGLNKAKSIVGSAFGNGLLSKIQKKVDSGVQVVGVANLLIGKQTTQSKKKNIKSNSATNEVDSTIKKFEEYTSKLFDWIEIRLDKLKDKTQSWLDESERAIKLNEKQKDVDNALGYVSKSRKANEKAAKKYQKTANRVAKEGGLSKDIINRIQNGIIHISSYDDDMQKKIKEYQKWYEKAEDCKKAVKELNDQEKELAKQKLDNIVDYYSDILDLSEGRKGKSSAKRDYLQEKGSGIDGASYTKSLIKTYDDDIEELGNIIKTNNAQKSKLQSELKKQMKAGRIKEGDKTWNEYQRKLLDIDAENYKAKTERVQLKDEKRQIKITQSENRQNRQAAKSQKDEKDRTLAEAKGLAGLKTAEKYYKKQITYAEKQNKELAIQEQLYRDMLDGLDPASEKYQEILESIEGCVSAQQDNNQLIEEYAQKINDIKYEKLEDALDRNNAKLEKLQDNLEMKNLTGKRVTRKDYEDQIAVNEANIDVYREEKAGKIQDRKDIIRDAMTDALMHGTDVNKAIDDAKSSKRYRELTKEIEDYDNKIRDTVNSNIQLGQSIANLPVQELEWMNDELENSKERIQSTIDISESMGNLSLKDVANGKGGYDTLSTITLKQNENYSEQIKAYRDMQKGMDELSPAYQELQQKIDSLTSAQEANIQSLQSYKDVQANAKLELLSSSYDALSSKMTQYNETINQDTIKGNELTAKSYQRLIDTANKQNANLDKQKAVYIDLMSTMDKNSSKYKEYEAELRKIDETQQKNITSTLEWQDAIANLDIEKLNWRSEAKTQANNHIQEQIDLGNASGQLSLNDVKSGKAGQNQMIKNAKSQNSIFAKQNDLLRERQKGMSKNSKAYQDLQKQIDSNTSSIINNLESIEKWKDEKFEAKISLLEHSYDKLTYAADQYNNEIDMKLLKGQELFADSYQTLIKNAKEQIKIKQKEKQAYLDMMVGLDKNSEKYIQYEKIVVGIDSEINSATKSTVEWSKAIQDLNTEKLEWAYDALSAAADKAQGNIDLKEAQGRKVTSNDYQKQIDIAEDQLDNLAKRRKDALNRQRGMDVNSKEYQEIQKEINSIDTESNNIKINIEGWKDAINEIPLKKLERQFDYYEEKIDKVNDDISLKNVSGKEVTASSYKSLISYGQKELEILNERKAAYEKMMADMVKQYGEGAVSSDKYKEMLYAVREIDDTTRDITQNMVEWTQAMKNLPIEKLAYQFDELEAKSQHIEEDISLKQASGQEITAKDYNKLISYGKSEISNLEKRNALLKQSQSGMDKYSEAYQDIQKQIDGNLSSINQIKVNIEGWEDSINQINLDNLQHTFDKLLDDSDRIQDDISMRKATGKAVTASQYKKLIGYGKDQINNLTKQKKAREALMAQIVKENGVTAKNSEKYRELEAEVRNLDGQIRDLTEANVEYNKSILELKLDEFEYKLNALSAAADRLNESISLHAAQGAEETSDTFEALIKNGMSQIQVWQDEIDTWRKEQKSMDLNSELYQQYEDKINKNISAINNMKVAQEEWNDSIIDLDLTKIQKYRDALQKNNNQYKKQVELQKTLQELEKANTQKTVRTYREGVGFVYEANQDEVKSAEEKLEDLIQDQLFDKIDDVIDAITEAKNDSNVYDANGNLLGTRYTTPQLGNLSSVLSSYYNKTNSQLDIAGLSSSLGSGLMGTGSAINSSAQQLSLDIGTIVVNEAKDGNEFAKAIVNQFPNALLQALYSK